jgi:hypothetical protein
MASLNEAGAGAPTPPGRSSFDFRMTPTNHPISPRISFPQLRPNSNLDINTTARPQFTLPRGRTLVPTTPCLQSVMNREPTLILNQETGTVSLNRSRRDALTPLASSFYTLSISPTEQPPTKRESFVRTRPDLSVGPRNPLRRNSSADSDLDKDDVEASARKRERGMSEVDGDDDDDDDDDGGA